jgi:transcriptional regulator with XRE-family HTH domain
MSISHLTRKVKPMSQSTTTLLRAARQQAGLSQKDLRARLAACGVPVSQPTISHYETGKRAPGTMEEIVALAAALQVEPEALIDDFADQRAGYARAAYLEKLAAPAVEAAHA